MLIYFHKNKCNYEKGQLAPFFIVVMVILVILALVTVNISKIGFIRTESANAVDAGALAAGSVMANLFNAIGEANRIMEEAYWDFYDKTSIYFISATSYLIDSYLIANLPVLVSPDGSYPAEIALQIGCSNPCYAAMLCYFSAILLAPAIPPLMMFIDIIEQIKESVQEFQEDQFDYYKDIRQAAKDGRCKAIKLGHKLAFMNSGIGEKVEDRGDFTGFLGKIECKETQEYKWTDGQGREHSVEIKVKIDKVEKFDLKVARWTLSQEIAALDSIIGRAGYAVDLMYAAIDYYNLAGNYFMMACMCDPLFDPWCPWYYCMMAIMFLIAGINCNIAAIEIEKQFFIDVPVAWNKLLPNDQPPYFYSVSDGDAYNQIITWIEEIDHNREVRVESKQKHGEREEPGIWNARYPETNTYSVVNFNYKDTGQIHHPRGSNTIEGPILRHLPSIVETDKIGQQSN